MIHAIVSAILLGAALGASPDPPFPTKPIILISWSAAGSPVDVLAREIAQLAPKYLGQQVVVEDKVGGDGAIAMAYLLGQAADGYTLSINTGSMAASLNTDLKGKFKTEQFGFLATLEADPYVLAVQSNGPYRTLKDLLAAASTGTVSIGGFGAESGASFFAKRLEGATRVKLNWVPFNGGSGAVAAVLGGHIAGVVVGTSGVMQQVEAGTLRVLAVASNDPLPQLRGVPTFRSLGYRDLTTSLWRGVMTRADVPAPIAAKLVDFLHKVYADPEFQNYVKSSGLLPYWMGREEFTRLVRREMDTIAGQIAGAH